MSKTINLPITVYHSASSLNAADSYYDEQEETDNSTTLDDGDYDDAADNTTMFDESDLDMQDEEPSGPGPIISVETGDQDSTDTVRKPNEPNFVAELDGTCGHWERTVKIQ